MKKILLIILSFMLTVFSFSSTTEEIIGTINPGKKYLAKIIDAETKRQGVSTDLMLSVYARESQFNNLEKNKANATGIGQMRPAAFKEGLLASGMSEKEYNSILRSYGNDVEKMRLNEALNIRSSVGYMKIMLKQNNGNVTDALMAYNMGQGNLNKYKAGKPISEAVIKEGVHYGSDVTKKIEIFKKARANGINSLSNKERNLLRNVDSDKNYGNYKGNNNEKSVVNYGETVSPNFDSIAEYLNKIIKENIGKLKSTAIIFLTILTSIQLVIDLSKVYLLDKYDEIFKLLFKKIIQFSTYLIFIKWIFDGFIIKQSLNISYGLTSILTGETGVQKITSIWTFKNTITGYLFKVMASLWSIDSIFSITSLLSDLSLTIFLIFIILCINLAFFMIMFDLFNMIVSFALISGLSSILIPLGVVDSTSQYYSISKLISMIINFITKMVAINFFAIVSMKALKESNIIEKAANGISISSILSGELILFLLLLFIVYDLIKNVDISF